MLRLQKARQDRGYDEDEWIAAQREPGIDWLSSAIGGLSWELPVNRQKRLPCKYEAVLPIRDWGYLTDRNEWDAGPLHDYVTTREAVGEILQFAKGDLTEIMPIALRERFDTLVRQWTEETRLSSSMREICTHPAYQEVIRLGEYVIPLIVEEMSMGELHWSWALSQITGQNPAANTESPRAATDVWLQWIQDHGPATSSSVRVQAHR